MLLEMLLERHLKSRGLHIPLKGQESSGDPCWGELKDCGLGQSTSRHRHLWSTAVGCNTGKFEDAKAEDALAEVITHIAPDFYASQHLTEGIGTECNSGWKLEDLQLCIWLNLSLGNMKERGFM